MMLVKQGVDISFAQGVDTKTDPKRVQMGKFLSLENAVFNKGGLLQKRNGYAAIASLPDTTYTYLTTFNNNLTAIGPNIAALNSSTDTWVTKGTITPLSVDVLPLIRNNLNQSSVDSVVAPNGLVCSVYLETTGLVTTNKYVISSSITGQNIIAPAAIPVASGSVSGGMRVFLVGNMFIIVFTNTITAVNHLQYIAISSNNPSVISVTNTDIAANYVPATTLSWDGIVVGNNLYIAYNLTSGGQAIKVTYINNNSPTPVTATTFTGAKATVMSLTGDVTNPTNPTIYISYYDSSTTSGYVAAVDQSLAKIMNPVQIISAGTILNMASAAQNGSVKVFYEISNTYPSPGNIATNYIATRTVTPFVTTFSSVFSSGAGSITVSSATGLVNGMYLIDNTTAANLAAGTTFTVSGTTLTLSANTTGNSASSPGDVLTAATITDQYVVVRSVGLASKAFIISSKIYFLSAYSSSYQPTYFLINGSTSTSASPVISAKLAYQNGGGYLTKGLPGVSLSGSKATIPYLIKDLIQAANKDTNAPAGTQVAGVYSQTGINLASFTFGTDNLNSIETGNDLHITGGFLSMYDGYLPVEHNFFLYPDPENTTPTANFVWSATGGNMVAQPDGTTNANAYYYQVTYEWTDNQGNAFRSAPSIPVGVTTTGSGTTGSVTINIPTLRLTMKVANPVKICIYRWSVAQQNYYEMTSIGQPLLNDPTADSVTIVDTSADSVILGNALLYTTGGVVEDINAPACNVLALFDSRLWLIDAENPNLLWYSKQVIQATPVEMSDLFTLYVPPTVSTQGTLGPSRTLFPMDDKLIIGKDNAFVYINGTGPDNTGANNQYSQAIFITSTVGCNNQRSFVLIPQGLLFQSNKGIWLLDRNLGTSYIGAPVEDFTQGATVLSAVNVPETNQVRFTLDSGITLMYDYYYSQWGVFTGVPCLSSCIFEEMHTFINEFGATYQEEAGQYLDGSNPVLLSFKTGPLRLGDLQGYQRAYFFYILGTYLTPHKLYVSLFYDYEDAPSQSILVSPTNFSSVYGSGTGQSPYGQGNPYGGASNLESWRVFLQRQRCMAFGIKVDEIYDPSFDVPAGAGLTISGLNVVMAFKKPFRPQSAAESAG